MIERGSCMKKLFEPVSLGGLELKNRLVRSATFDLGMAEDGVILPAMVDFYRQLAEGGVGLIITGMFGVCINSRNIPGMIKTYGRDFESGFRAVVDCVHEHGVKIVAQLVHTGVKATVLEEGERPWGASDFGDAREMTREQMALLVKGFEEGAARCKAAGADGVQLHGAHGYLLSQFLSPYYNKRTDEYGGDIEGRSRLLREAYAAIREAVGPDYPVLLKLNYNDLVSESITGEECIWLCKELERMGLTAVEISSGVAADRNSNAVQRGTGEAFNGEYALRVAEQVKMPVISVGGYRKVATMEDYLNRGGIAAISLSRPLIREPDLPRRWQEDPSVEPACVSCNACFKQTVLKCGLK